MVRQLLTFNFLRFLCRNLDQASSFFLQLLMLEIKTGLKFISGLFWDFSQRRMVSPYRRFGDNLLVQYYSWTAEP